MSFILDALRKSEHERQRQTGPALAEVAIAQPRPRTNVWATAAIALLLVNLVVIGVLLIRKAGHEPGAAAPAAAVQAPAPAPVLPPASSQAPAQVSMTQTVPAPGAAAAAPPMLQPAGAATTAAEPRNPLGDEVSGGEPTLDPQLVAHAAAAPAGPPAVTRTPAGRGSVVYESLPDSATVGGPQHDGSASAPSGARAPEAGPKLPTADELSAAGGVPALNLELHVYSTKPAERMVFVNSRKYREGDTLQEGPVVREIIPSGVILEFRGNRFLLSRD
jgi:general secretion pathway protein B